MDESEKREVEQILWRLDTGYAPSIYGTVKVATQQLREDFYRYVELTR